VTLSVVAVAAVIAVAFCLTPRPATAADMWLERLDKIAAEFTGEMIVDGKSYPLDGPRRVMFYTPEKSPISNVVSGACYALHIKGNPEVIIAIENCGDPTRPSTYIEVSRLSGGEINIYRKGWRTIEFPARAEVRGAYVGMTVEQ